MVLTAIFGSKPLSDLRSWSATLYTTFRVCDLDAPWLSAPPAHGPTDIDVQERTIPLNLQMHLKL